MGLKKFFKLKPPEEDTPEQNRINLQDAGISVKNQNKRNKQKFAAYGRFANDKAKNSKIYAPPGYEQYAYPQEEEAQEDFNQGPGEMNPNSTDPGRPQNSDPYASGYNQTNYIDPYGNNSNNQNSYSDPYSSKNNNSNFNEPNPSNDPYSAMNKDPYSSDLNSSPYDNDPYRVSKFSDSNSADPYASNSRSSDFNSDPYSSNQNRNYGNQAASFQQNNRNTSMKKPNPYTSMDSTSTTTYGNQPYDKKSPNKNSSSRSSAIPAAATSAVGAAATSAATVSGSATNYNAPTQANSGRINIQKSDGNPYATMSGDAYPSSSTNVNNGNPYSKRSYTSQNYGLSKTSTSLTTDLNRTEQEEEAVMDLNKKEFDFEDNYKTNINEYNQAGFENTLPADGLDLNEPPTSNNYEGDDLNATLQEQQQVLKNNGQQAWQIEDQEQHYDYDYNVIDDYSNNGGEHNRGYKTFEEIQMEEENRQRAEEEGAIDELKQEIKFTKQASVASTRNTLKMAHEAEMAGMNTIGMLGHQSEKLNSIENNLNLMKVQNKTADDRVAELRNLNRSIFAIHAKNPFTSKRRQQEKEDRLKTRKIEENLINERTAQNLYNSTRRIEGALNGENELAGSSVRERYARDAILDRSKKYQFENDEEDDAMEIEIDRNLDKVQQVSGRLKKLALAVGDELDSQQERIKDIEETADDLDIKIHMNTIKLSNVH